MKFWNFCACGVAASALAAAMAPAAYAQQITSEIRGSVTDPSGAPLSGASVTLTDTRTNASRTATTQNNGEFAFRNLTVGGPFVVTVTATNFRGERLEGIQTSLSGATSLSFQLQDQSAGADVILVTGTRANISQVAIGPNSAFDLETQEAFPSISRDIRDIIRIDPRVSIDLSGEVQRVSCLGGNDRSNTFTVDGVIQADVFGLNGTPFASRNAFVVPFDSVAQTSVEFAPFDVEYGQFTGCNINVVTKSGSNEFHGSAFFNYAGSGLVGKKRADGSQFDVAEFDDYNWGGSLGGPIIKDKLFFFVAYEETDDADFQANGPIGGGFANEGTQNEPDLATTEAVQAIFENVYGYPTGGIATSLPQSNRRILTRWDWLINDDHRLEFTYQRLRETNVESDDYGFDPEGFTFFGSFEDEGTRSETYSARLFSQWTDNFSTEIRASRADVLDVQGPVSAAFEAGPGNLGLPRLIVGTGDFGQGDTTIVSGPGLFRSANNLDSKVDQLKLKANYQYNNHTFTAGYELNHLDVFNLFIVDGTGTLFFQNIADLEAGILSGGTDTFVDFSDVNTGDAVGGTFGGSFSGDPADAGAEFQRAIHSLYIQDEWQVNDRLNILLGLRHEYYSSTDAPQENPNFEARYGFSNARDFSDLSVWLPRFGFTYNADDKLIFSDIQYRGGVGVFSGGDPTVWFANAFSNAGGNVGASDFVGAGCDPMTDGVVLSGGVFTGVPQCMIDAARDQAANNAADTQSTDPNLKIPSVIRANLGFTGFTNFSAGEGFFDDWRVDIDYIYSRFANPFNFVDLAQTIDFRDGLNGFTIDGRPIYAAIDPTATGCNAVLEGTGGTPPTYSGVTAECFATSRDDEIQLTNSDGFSAHVASLLLSKNFEYGRGSTRFSFGYSYTDAENRRDLTSSRSVSNYDGTALFDRQNPSVGTSGFQTKHSIAMALNTSYEIIKDYPTRLGIFYSASTGRPYSYTFDGSGVFSDSSSGSDNALLYVPTGVDDPNVVFDSAATANALNAYIDATPCLAADRGRTATRNGCRNPWFHDVDLRFQQALPVPGDFWEDRLTFYADIDNVLNLIDSGANVRNTFNSEVDLVDVSIDSEGRYNVSGFFADEGFSQDTAASIWSVQFGVRYEF